MGFLFIRIDTDGSLIGIDGIIEFTLQFLNISQGGISADHIFIFLDGRLKCLGGIHIVFLPLIDIAHPVMRQRKTGFDGHRFFIFFQRFRCFPLFECLIRIIKCFLRFVADFAVLSENEDTHQDHN